MENNHAKSESSSTNSFLVGILSRKRNLHNYKKIRKIAIPHKLFELQLYGLTCVVRLICGLIDNTFVKFKNMSATRFSYFGYFETECPLCTYKVY